MPKEGITLCDAWVILARAMCIVDKEALPIEQETAAKYAFGQLKFKEAVFSKSKNDAHTHTFQEAMDHIKTKELHEKELFLFGLAAVAAADDKFKDEELELLACLAQFWGIDDKKVQELIYRGNILRELV